MMEKRKLNKILSYFREEMMTSGSNPQGFSSAAKAEGPTAGFDPVQGKMQKRKKPVIIYLKGARKNWKKSRNSWIRTINLSSREKNTSKIKKS